MFGFLRPERGGCVGRRYRQVYAAMCAYQRREYGQLSSFFNSYEAIFLYHLAIESGVCDAPAELTPTCCRLRSDTTNRWNLDLRIARFCSAYAMVLAAVKIEDDVRDNHSMLSRCTESFFRRRFAAARQTLDELSSGLSSRLREHVQQHLELERRNNSMAMEEYVRPTANAFGELFDAFQILCGQQDWKPIGESIGTAIIAADCAFDFDRDRQRREFNPLPSRAARESAMRFAQGALSDAGWRCCDDEAPGVCSYVLRSTFDRLGRFVDHLSTPPQKLALSRRGECDCVGDLLCNVCGEAMCSGCGDAACSGLGDLACDSICSSKSGCDASCCSGFDCSPSCDGCTHCDLCDLGRNRKKKDGEQPPALPDENLGEEATSVGQIDQHGIVSLGGRTYPARSQRNIEDGERVTVVQANRFGLTVV